MSKTKLEIIQDDYEWIVKIIRSSETYFQCECCDKLIKNFVMKYNDHAKMGDILKDILLKQRQFLNNIFDEQG
jgi:hypothetical protein